MTSMRAMLAMTLALTLAAAPLAIAEHPGHDPQDPPEQAIWGLCTAEDNNEDGDEASNGTVYSAPPFANTTDDECDSAQHPRNASWGPFDDRPGQDDHPDNESHPNGSDDRGNESDGSDQRDGSGDPGSSGGSDRGEDEADDRR